MATTKDEWVPLSITAGIAADGRGADSTARSGRRWWLAVGVLVALAFALRTWSISHGLPFLYNVDEQNHFVPRALSFFSDGYNPHYFTNPPAFTYFLHGVFALLYGSGDGAMRAQAIDPSQPYLIGRLAAAALGTLAVLLVYLTGRRFFGRGAGLLAAGILAVAFLPVFYAHHALNDVATLVPVSLSLFATAEVFHRGRLVHFIVAGLAAGVAAATKYPGAIVLLPLLVAGGSWVLRRDHRRRAWFGLALASLAFMGGFLLANPYAVLDHSRFLRDFFYVSPAHTLTVDVKPGVIVENGVLYYLWTLTWGLGWVPLVAWVVGSGLLFFDDRRLAAVLVPPPLLYLLYMGSQGRFLARWFLPAYPLVILIAAYGLLRVASAVKARRVLHTTVVALLVAATLGQGVAHSVHLGSLLARTDTRELARGWLMRNVPAESTVLIEPGEPGRLLASSVPGRSPRDTVPWTTVRTNGEFVRAGLVPPGIERLWEDYVRTLRPALIDVYIDRGICWVIAGVSEARADALGLQNAMSYYRELRNRARILYHVSPYRGERRHLFNLDWSYNYYPFAFERPGPEITIFRLNEGACSGGSTPPG